MVMRACYPSTGETETGGHPGFLGQSVSPVYMVISGPVGDCFKVDSF